MNPTDFFDRAWLTPRETFLLLLCSGLLAWQLLLPGFIGMANNGDFPKMAGPLCLAGADRETEKFIYFQADYIRGPASCYDPGIRSSEFAPAWLASSLEQALGDDRHFDIRWLGAIHALLFIGFYAVLLRLLRPLDARAATMLSLAALWIFADVSVIAYLNSFYTDVLAILGGMTATILAVNLIAGETERLWPLLVFAFASLCLVTSKGQHTPLVAFAVALLVWRARRSREKRFRLAAGIASVALICGTIWSVAVTPPWLMAQARFSLIFSKIAKLSPTPAQDLRELGLAETDVRYVGMHAFLPGAPLSDAGWSERFSTRTSTLGVLRFYLAHPDRVFTIFRNDLAKETGLRHLYSNYRKQDGRPPGAQTQRWSSWAWLRTKLFAVWPEHMVCWYALALLAAPWMAARARTRFESAILWTVFWAALAGLLEFAIATLADGAETSRHLFLFHVFTDVTIFLALVSTAARIGRRGKKKRPTSPARLTQAARS